MDAVNFTTRHVGATVARLSNHIRKLDDIPAESVNIEPRVVETWDSGITWYEAVTVATTVIYWPEDIAGERHYTPRSTPSSGLDELPKYLPTGGSIVSVHQPTEALAWLEANYDTHRLVRFIRKKFGGPVAALISPDEQGLTIFGPHSEPIMARLAQKLANASQFPVMSRPAAANPALTFYPRVSQGKTLARGGHLLRDEGLNRGLPSLNSSPLSSLEAAHTEATILAPPGLTGNVSASSGHLAGASLEGGTVRPPGNGSGDNPDAPTSEAEEWEEWASPIHWKQTEIKIQTGDSNLNHTFVCLQIRSQTQFKTYPDEMAPADPTRTWRSTRPQAQVHTNLTMQFPAQVILDRSWATLGFEGHRAGSILASEDLPCDLITLTPPKHTLSENDQNSFNASFGLGLAGGIPSPTAAVGYQHAHSTTRTREVLDTDPTMLYDITRSPGESWGQKDGKSYESYNYSYTAPKVATTPVQVEFAFGINFFDLDSKGELLQPPQVSYINRNQILIWLKDPELRSGMRGLIVLLSNQVPDIRRHSKISSTAVLNVRLNAPGEAVESTSNRGNDDGASSSAVLPIRKQKDSATQNTTQKPSTVKGVRARTKKTLRMIRPAPPQLVCSSHEPYSRGWDATDNEWREAIYPELDRYLQSRTIQDAAFTISPL